MDGSEEDFGDEDGEDGDALLRDSTALKGGRGGVLEPGYLNIVRRVCRASDKYARQKTLASAPWRAGGTVSRSY